MNDISNKVDAPDAEGSGAARSPEALHERALAHPTSKRFAIHARCAQCESGDEDPGWRDRVRGCSVKACSLNTVRPYQPDESAEDETTKEDAQEPEGGKSFDPVAKARANPKSRAMAVRAYCWTCMGGGRQPNVQSAISACSVTSCALHHVRPYRPKQSDIEINGQ